VLGLRRDRPQSDREHRCCTSAVVANDPCLSQGARSRQPRWSCSLDTAAVISIPDGLECRIVGAQRLEPHEAVNSPAQVDSMFDTSRSRHDQGSGDLGPNGLGMFGWFISSPPFGAEQGDRIAVTALPQGQRMKP
jgi:hypothetical protein